MATDHITSAMAAPPETPSRRGAPVHAIDLPLSPARVAVALGAVGVLLVLAGIAGEVSRLAFGHGQLGGVVPLFNLDAEGNLPSYFSALLLLAASAGVALIARLRAQHRLPHVRTLGVLAVILLFLSLDEATAIHELLSGPVRDSLDLDGILYYAWVIVYGAAVVVFIAVFAPRLRQVEPMTRRLLALAVGVYLAGALGLELAQSAYTESTDGADDAIYAAFTTLEETLEIAAVILLVYTILRALQRQSGEGTPVRLLAASRPPAP
jgi:hypothetical protein